MSATGTGHMAVVAHEATRTGSPRVLIELLSYVRPRISRPLSIRLLAGGPLSDELLELGDSVGPDSIPVLAFANGAAAAGELHAFDLSVPTVAYVHEEGEALENLADVSKRALRDRASLILCVSDRARDGLIAMGADPDRLVVLPPVVSQGEGPAAGQVRDAEALLHRHGDTPIVVGCGEAGWRKGADLFVDVASRVRRRRDVDFAWIGLRPRVFSRILDHDCRMLDLVGHLRWLGECDDVSSLLASADVLLMTSREDPQPLVPFEAALAGTPTVGFRIGGLADLIADDCAVGAPYPDTDSLAQALVSLLDDPTTAELLVSKARDRIAVRHSVDVLGPRFLDTLSSLCPDL